jgi:hypothetical protein
MRMILRRESTSPRIGTIGVLGWLRQESPPGVPGVWTLEAWVGAQEAPPLPVGVCPLTCDPDAGEVLAVDGRVVIGPAGGRPSLVRVGTRVHGGQLLGRDDALRDVLSWIGGRRNFDLEVCSEMRVWETVPASVVRRSS